MNKRLVLVDWNNKRKEFDIPDFENVLFITIRVISSDEVAIILYKNGEKKVFDSSNDRRIDYFDCFYLVPLDKIEEFNNLQGSSYDRAKTVNLWERSEDEETHC